MPLLTREVRWFFDGSLAATGAATAAWFAEAGRGGAGSIEALVSPQDRPSQGWRTDHYLRLPNAPDVSVKLRQGRLEIKGCHSFVGVQRFSEGIEGEVGCWTKWTVDLPQRVGLHERGDDADGGHGLGGLATLRVAKQRVLRRVRFTKDEFVEVPAAQQVDRGLHMELTRLCVNEAPEETHWSLGFEAFLDDPSCCALFAAAVARLLDGCPAKPLRMENSMAYPRWLQRLGPGERSQIE